jgi:ActD protein
MTNPGDIYGLVAEFDDPNAFVQAARATRDYGFHRFEAYSPYPIKALDKIIKSHNFVAPIVLGGGLLGAAIAWSMQYYIAAIDYPTNVGGRPLYSWPSFIPILFELTVLLASCGAFFGTLALCGFPRPNFPLFNLPRFAEASSSRFFLCIEAHDPYYEPSSTVEFLQGLGPIGVWEVENS